MNKDIKNIFIILFLFLLIVGVIGTVSATTEYNYANATAFLNNITKIESNSIITINSSEANVSASYTISASNITIKSENGSVIFNGNSNSAHFFITGSNVTLYGLTFKNLHGYTHGGALTWNGANGTVECCNFTDNIAEYGAAIMWYGIYGHISDCNFNSNKAYTTSGALYWNGANGTVECCNFTNNNANTYAGALYWNSINGTLKCCIFTNNYANYGGALTWIGKHGIVEYCNFFNNSANWGGSLYWRGVNGTVESCNFTNDKTNNGNGGSLYWYAANGTVDSCNFINSTANGNGGALTWNGANGTLINCNFTNNEATKCSGSLYWEGVNGTVEGCKFINSTATNSGTLYWLGFNGTVDSCIFINSTAINGNGGVLTWNGANGTVIGCEFNNSAAINGNGGALSWQGCYGNIVNCNFTNSSAILGSAIHILNYDSESTSDNMTLLNNLFTDCESTGSIDANVFNNNTRNLNITGGEGAIIHNNGTNASISTLVSVLMTGNVTEVVTNDTVAQLCAQITVGNNYKNYIIGENLFNFTIEDKTIKTSIPGTLNGTNYTCEYPIKGSLGDKITVSGICMVNAPIEYLNGTLQIKDNSTLNITVEDITYGENLTVTVNVNPSVATGNVTIFINGRKINTTELKSGVASFNVEKLSSDNYILSASYNGDDKYINVTNTTHFNVNKAEPIIIVDVDNINYGENATIYIDVNGVGSIPTGNVSIVVDGKAFIESLDLIGGSTQYIIPDLVAGNYNITVIYNGNKNYTTKSGNKSLVVGKLDTKLSVDVNHTRYDSVVLIMNLTDIHGEPLIGDVDVTVISDNGYKYKDSIIINGTKTLTLLNLNNGHYNVTVTYNATKNYNSSSDNNNFDINYIPEYSLNASNVVKYYCNDTQYHVTLTDDHDNPVANKTILVTLNCYRWTNVQYNITTNASGIATLDINLYSGFYTITATFDNAIPVTTNITVKDVFETQDVVKYYKNATQFAVKVTDKVGNPASGKFVTVKLFSEKWLSSVTYTIKTNDSGIAVLPINLIPRVYSIVTTVDGISKRNNIAVFPTLTANNLVKKVSQSASLTARIVDGQGNPVEGKEVKFTVKTKTYTFKTDSNGIATLPIHLGLGTWSFLISIDNAETRATVKVIK